MSYLGQLPQIANRDVKVLQEKDREYGGSWKKRGGVGAFMMLARKWDRLEEQAKSVGYDIFKLIAEDKRPEGIIDDLRDLRRYLMLVEAECLTRDYVVDINETVLTGTIQNPVGHVAVDRLKS